LHHRSPSAFSRIISAAAAVVVIGSLVVKMSGQGPQPLTLLSRDGIRTLPVASVGDRDAIALDDLAAAFQLTVREESGAVTVSSPRGRTVVLTPDQALASVAGRLVSLPAPLVRAGGRWMVPVEFISRALAPISDVRLDLRRASNLVVIGDLRVPRVIVRYEALPASAHLTIDITPTAASTISQESGRLLVRFEADALDPMLPAIQPQGLLQAIRAVDPSTIALELGPRFVAYRASTQPSDTSTRLSIDLLTTIADTAAPPSPGPPPAAAPTTELPVFGQPATAIRTIVIDPGHGGDDRGAAGAGGTVEKDLTLSVARRLKATIDARLGVRVLLTRDDDRNVPLDRRTAVANNNKADLFISLHANASARPTASGATVYVAAFTDDDERRTSMSNDRLPVFGGGSRDLELVLWDFAQVRFLDRSSELARLIGGQFEQTVPLEARPIDTAPFRVLESANMPAVLIEMGYLTNPAQERLLQGAEFQGTLVQGIFNAIVQFRDYLDASANGER
jgi:N-acetylmuramoyl-L-alanine amidase